LIGLYNLRNPVSAVGRKKPGFCCWGKETGIKVVNIAAIFSASKPQIPVGAKHDRRQIIAENINLNTGMLRPTLVQ